MKNIKIAPSILSANFAKMGEEVRSLEQNGADIVHCDVMDGVFVNNITFGIKMVEDIRKVTKLPLDCLKPHRISSRKGEKKMKDQSNRTHLIKAYLDDSEYEYFRRIAVATKRTNSDLVRRLLQTSVFVEFPPIEYREIIDQLEHIGINLNQLTSKAHSLGFIDEPQYRKNANEVWRMVARLAQIYLQVGARIDEDIRRKKGKIV